MIHDSFSSYQKTELVERREIYGLILFILITKNILYRKFEKEYENTVIEEFCWQYLMKLKIICWESQNG